MKWQKEVDTKLNRISNKHSIKRQHLDYMMTTFFSNMKKQLQKESMPTVMIHRFGEFAPSRKKVSDRISYINSKLKEGNVKSRDHYLKEKERLTNILNRLKQEQTTRNG